ncbi:MAG: glycoside hydrolase family 43 protein [Spirochaetales bacterium]|nr:glycoside hydrolase family 43 protein [Spirochaetales bacterium]
MLLKKTLCSVTLLFLFGCTSLDSGRVMPMPEDGQSVYLFSCFTENGQDGVRLLSSLDGLNWFWVNKGKPILRPMVGEHKLTRDPCIIRGRDNRFHMVWTTGWDGQDIGISHSSDLVNWDKQTRLDVMGKENKVLNCWAPEIFYDEKSKFYYIFWASTIPGRFSESDGFGDANYNHRIYFTKTDDFVTYSETKLFYDAGFNVIDNHIQKVGDKYVMFLKNETLKPFAEKNIRVVFADSIEGPWSQPSEPIHEDYWAEGPSAIKIADRWFVYYDRYSLGSMGLATSDDLINWADCSKQLRMPRGVRHGTIFVVSSAEYQNLIK